MKCPFCQVGSFHSKGRKKNGKTQYRCDLCKKTSVSQPEEKAYSHIEVSLRKQLSKSVRDNLVLQTEIDRLQARLGLLEQINESEEVVLDYLHEFRADTERSRKHLTCAVAIASDWHVGESVDPKTVNGKNAFDLEICTRRAGKFFEGVAWLVNHHNKSFDVPALCLAFIGDMINGFLHESMMRTNNLTPPEEVLFVRALMKEGIQYLLDQCPSLQRIVVPMVHGNHGRLGHQRRTPTNTRSRDSYEHIVYSLIEQDFKDNDRVRCHQATGQMIYLKVFDWVLGFTHGDSINYNGGVGGIGIPLAKAYQNWETFQHCDVLNFGHFHQFMDLQWAIGNGSLVGYNAFALAIKAKFELPVQAFYLMDSRHGKINTTPVWTT